MSTGLFADLLAGGDARISALKRLAQYQQNPALAPLLKYLLPAGMLFYGIREVWQYLPRPVRRAILKLSAGAGGIIISPHTDSPLREILRIASGAIIVWGTADILLPELEQANAAER